MSIWQKIAQFLEQLSDATGLSQLFEQTPPERSVGFTIALIALGAKMAKADGQVTRNEVTAFRQIFHIDKSEEKNAARLFNLARRDVAGFEAYAQKISSMFRQDRAPLRGVIEGLLFIAMADGEYHPEENRYIQTVAQIFGIPDAEFQHLRSLYVPFAAADPYAVLGMPLTATHAELQKKYRQLVRDNHPDKATADGLPPEAVKLANAKLAVLNAAWAEINKKAGA